MVTISVGKVFVVGSRLVRVSGMPDGVTLCRDNRGRIAVRNVETNRLSYVSEPRLQQRSTPEQIFTRNQMTEVLTALWDMQQSPDCWCDAGDDSPMHSPACAYARDVARKYKSLAYPEGQ